MSAVYLIEWWSCARQMVHYVQNACIFSLFLCICIKQFTNNDVHSWKLFSCINELVSWLFSCVCCIICLICQSCYLLWNILISSIIVDAIFSDCLPFMAQKFYQCIEEFYFWQMQVTVAHQKFSHCFYKYKIILFIAVVRAWFWLFFCMC